MEKLGFGLMRLPTIGGDPAKVDMEQLQTMVDAFLTAGGTYFDTAAPYHKSFSEQAFRETVVKRYPRDRFTITDKLTLSMVSSAEDVPVFFAEQLNRCGVTYFDYYLVHALTRRNYGKAQHIKAFEFIARMRAEGKIQHIGFSFHDTPELLEQILSEHPEMEYVQLQLNYLDWEDHGIHARQCYEIAVAHHKPVIVMEPVKGGALAQLPEEAEQMLKELEPDKSPASWAIRFAATQEQVVMVLSGMGSIAQMRDNLSYMKNFVPLNEKELKALGDAAAVIRSRTAVPCTYCRYCVSEQECPKSIAIPDCFALYNNKRRHSTSNAAMYYQSLVLDHGKASECIGCGRCESFCPQHLPIRKYLKEVASTLE